MKKFLISEEERSRILGMHHNAIRKEFLFEAGPPMADDTLGIMDPTATDPTATTPEPNLQVGAAIGGTATTPNTQAGASVVGKATDKVGETLLSNDKDYNYKKVGDKYYFKLKPNPATPKLQALVKQGKFTDWTLATKPDAVSAISKLNFKSENLETKPLSAMKVDSTTTSSGTTSGTTVGGGGKPLAQLAGTPTPDLLKQFPNLGTLDQATQTKITTWTKSPAGQYILNTPADQREKAMDNLDKMFGGDPLTKELKKPIRQALGMKADTLLGRVGSAIKGGVEGVKQGFNQQK